MEVTISNDIEELSRQFAGWMIAYIKNKLQQQQRFSLVLSGGNTPKKLYQLLSSDAYRGKIDWSRIDLFWGDERYVPITDDRNNAKMAFDNLLDHLPVDKKHIHLMRTDIEPEAAATEYEQLLQHYFPNKQHTFDLVLLGLGDNAHTLSLFPGYPVVQEKEHWVRSFFLEEQEMYRITLTAPVVNHAAAVAFLVTGADKAVALQQVIHGKYEPEVYPAQLIKPVNGNIRWWIDEAAAGDLQKY
jgi:6-phosphogluconolactonase